MVNSSLYHALFNIRHYGRRYGASKQFRVILHYSFIVLKKFFPNKRFWRVGISIYINICCGHGCVQFFKVLVVIKNDYIWISDWR